MSLRLVAYVFFAASCAKGGAEIRVSVSTVPDIKTIELYVGVGNEKTTYLVPQNHTVYPQVSTWARDAFNEVDRRDVVSGELTVFQFIDAPDKQLGVVIAVGLNDAGTPIAAAAIRNVMVPTDKIARYELALAALDPYFLVLEYWGAEPTKCVALADKRKNQFDAVLPPNDRDCDGKVPECADTFFDGARPPTLEETQCLMVASSGPSSGACALVGPACVDGMGSVGGCTTPSAYCVASSTCAYCNTFGAEALDCARNLTPVPGVQLPPHFQCSINYLSDGTICQDPIPSSEYAQSFFLQCDVESGRISRGESMWSQQISYSNGVTIGIKDLDATCNFVFAPSGHTSAGDLRMGGMVAAKFTNGRGIAVPVVFTLAQANACGTPRACIPPIFDTADTMLQTCLTTATPVTP